MNTVGRFAARAAVASFVVFGSALMPFAPDAKAVTYTTSGLAEPLRGLGDTMGTQYDVLAVDGYSGVLNEGTIRLNWLSFTAGINAYVPQDYNNVYSIKETMSIGGGQSQQINIPFNLSISYSDTLTVIGGTTFSFTDAGTLWQVVVNGLTLGPNSGGTMGAWLTAQVTDPPGVSQTPLPAALPLFASGLGGIGLFSWWRKRKRVGAGAVG